MITNFKKLFLNKKFKLTIVNFLDNCIYLHDIKI